MELELRAEVWSWHGPAPHHFVTVPPRECADLATVAPFVSYGWGMVPVTVTLGGTTWPTSLWPKDGGYVVPLKASVRRAEGVEIGDLVTVRLVVGS